MDSSRMFSFSTVLDRWRLTRVSRYESGALKREIGLRSVLPGFGMRVRPHILSGRERRRVERISGTSWSRPSVHTG